MNKVWKPSIKLEEIEFNNIYKGKTPWPSVTYFGMARWFNIRNQSANILTACLNQLSITVTNTEVLSSESKAH